MKIKMELKAKEKPEWGMFLEEIRRIVDEQGKFVESLEMTLALIDLLDPVQARTQCCCLLINATISRFGFLKLVCDFWPAGHCM